jgi:hypothetical protein
MNGPFDRKRAPAPRAPLPARSPADRRVPPPPAVSRSEEEEARSSSKYRAALEALFAPKKPAAPLTEPPPPERSPKKMVALPTRDDPRGPEREKRLAKLLAAEGRAAVTKAAEDFAGAGFDFPEEQDVMLKLLDHDADDRVRAALECLGRLLAEEVPQRRAVLDARLRRLEETSDDAEVRALAGGLRKKLQARAGR